MFARHTLQMPVKKRWEKYRDSRIRAKLPAAGSQSLSLATCHLCGALEVGMDGLRCRVDVHAVCLREDIALRKKHHSRKHYAERDYANDI
eukprot:6213744-Pleurochrysis_carterae.AAC.4